MEHQKESYRHVFKAISLFGGVQIIQVIIILIRSKIIAIYLGPTGLGINSIFMSTTSMINAFTGLGLNFSAVRDISQANDSNDVKKISRVVIIFKRWINLSAILGTLLTIVLATQLSKFAFGNTNYSWAFTWLSLTLLFTSLSNGNIALLQGLQLLKAMAKATVIGSLFGLVISFPFYYFFGVNGLVPALILGTVTVYLISKYFSSKVIIESIKVTFRETYFEGKEMVKLGMVMMAATFIGAFSTYLVNAYIRSSGGLADVGLYQAGISLTNQYIGMVFAAMSLDYFPRLAAISKDNEKVKRMVNEQSFIVILITAPLLIALLFTAPLVVRILLSSDFFPIIDLVRVICIGMLFKAAAFPIGYIAFAKGDKMIFFFIEGLLGNLITLSFNIACYHYFGLIGLGYSLVLSFIIYLLIICVITYKRYKYKIEMAYIKIFVIQLGLCILTYISTILFNNILTFFIGVLFFCASTLYSLIELDKRLDLKHLIGVMKNTYSKK